MQWFLTDSIFFLKKVPPIRYTIKYNKGKKKKATQRMKGKGENYDNGHLY